MKTHKKYARHGHTVNRKNSKTYMRWSAMIQRCVNKNNSRYSDYGGRGISVCKRWLSFANFLEDMGAARDGMTIERIDNNKGYSKENCRWATQYEQQANTRKSVLITYNGETRHLQAWSRKLSINPRTISSRLKKGCTVEVAFSKKSLLHGHIKAKDFYGKR